jgi:hypothetical protein
MTKRQPAKALLSIRIDSEVARRARELVRNEAGAPRFLRLGSWVQAAIEAHLIATMESIEGERQGRRRPPLANNRI